jgi:hypothetical protein
MEMTLDQALEKLKSCVKKSEALDGAYHFDLTLISAQERSIMDKALVLVKKALRTGELSEAELEKRTALKAF